jgi:hypothetical protein
LTISASGLLQQKNKCNTSPLSIIVIGMYDTKPSQSFDSEVLLSAFYILMEPNKVTPRQATKNIHLIPKKIFPLNSNPVQLPKSDPRNEHTELSLYQIEIPVILVSSFHFI